MALLTTSTAGNKLGPFAFVEWTNERGEGPPEQTLNRSVAITHPGVDGVAVRRDGLVPDSFAMVSGLDVTSFTAARTLLALYDKKAKEGPMLMTYGGVTWGKYSVLSVKLMSLTAVSGGSGGFNGTNARAYLRARWELVQVEAAT